MRLSTVVLLLSRVFNSSIQSRCKTDSVYMSDQQGEIAPNLEQDLKNGETTIVEVITPTEITGAPKEDTVPLSALLDMKRANKEISRELKRLKETIEEGANRADVSSDMQALSDKHNVDADFLKDFAKAVRAEAKQATEDEITEKLKPLHEKERLEKMDKAFNAHFSTALEAMPEYVGVVNKNVIKELSLSPANANKTFTQLIEESYGHLITGKRSIDAGSKRVSKNDTNEVDTTRAQKDPEYFREVMANPSLKEKYNKSMFQRVASQM